MSKRPITFTPPEVRALLDGRTTQTRRLQFDARGRLTTWGRLAEEWARGERDQRIWVRENFALGFDLDDHDMPIGDEPKLFFAATYDGRRWLDRDTDEWRDEPKWTPSIHMPRRCSRLTLDVTDVRVQRLQEISEEDARAEGVERDAYPCDHARRTCDEIGCLGPTHRSNFASLWNGLHGDGSWDANPLVVAITFLVYLRNIDAMVVR